MFAQTCKKYIIIVAMPFSILCSYVYPHIQGSVFDSVGDVPADKRELALVSMMETMADIHSVHWFPEMNRNLKSEHKTTQSFWEEEVGATGLVVVHGASMAAILVLI